VRKTTIWGLGAAALMTTLLLAGCAGGGPRRDAVSGASGSSGSRTVATTTAGNGISAKSTSEIVAASEAALRSARSVRVKLTSRDADGKVRMDVKLTSGKDASGWIEQGGLRFNLIVFHGNVYIQGRELWRKQGGAAAAELIGNRWVKAPKDAAKDLGPFGKELTIRGLADEIFGDQNRPVFMRKAQATLHGQPAVRLIAADGSYYVAGTGKPYPLLADGNGNIGDVEFLQYDQDFGIKAPAGALDIDQLQAQSG
jgi:hypothetical protein